MCEKEIHGISMIPCKICVVSNCDDRNEKTAGCPYGKPSNEMIKWAFGYTNALRCAGIKK